MEQMSREEKEFLKQYDITRFERPSIAADMAIFTVMGDEKDGQARDSENYRKFPEKKLKILLIKRGSFPCKGQWALPGGFCQRGEEVLDAAHRELLEETQVGDAYLKLAGVFGEEGRDPRGWIISHTFLALLAGEKCHLKAGSDAWDARWFDVELTEEEEESEKEQNKEQQNGTTFERKTVYRLTLVNRQEEESITLKATVREERTLVSFQVKTKYVEEETKGFAFDHAKIIVYSLLYLRRQAKMDGRIVFDLLPDRFTLTQMQNACEIILGHKLLTANFRRKIADYVVETDQMLEGAGHRPARLYKRNLQSVFLDD